MALNIPIPQYLAAAQAPTGLSALLGGAERGVGTLQAFRQRQLQQQALQQQMAAQQIAQQAAQERLKALPAQLEAEQQRRYLGITHDIQADALLRAQMRALPQQQAADLALKHAQLTKLLGDYHTKNPLALYNLGKSIFDKNPNDPRLHIIGQMIGGLTTPKQGISIGTNPTGGMSVQIGGQQAFPGPSPFGTPLVNPVTKGARGAKGATYTDQETGQIYSTPTVGETGKLQQTVLGDKQLANIANTMVKDVDDVGFFDPETHIESWAATPLKFLDPSVAQKRSGLLGIKNKAVAAAERLMTLTNAPRTEENMHRAMAIFMPEMGESKESYKNRIAANMALFKKNSQVASEALKKGALVGTMPYKMVQLPPRSFMDYIHPRYEYVRNPDHQAPPQQPAVAPTPDVQPGIPKYTQEDLEFTAKKHGISVEEVKRRLGG